MEQLKKLFKKLFSREVILYGIFGVLTTIVNLGVSYLLEGVFHINGAIASAVGIICAVLFAYFTNRKLVFNSTAEGFNEKLKELVDNAYIAAQKILLDHIQILHQVAQALLEKETISEAEFDSFFVE